MNPAPQQLDYAHGATADRSRRKRTSRAIILFVFSLTATPVAYVGSIFLLFASTMLTAIIMPGFYLAAYIGSSYEPALRRAGVGELSVFSNVLLTIVGFGQIPAYGLILAIALYRGRFRRGLAVVALVHVLAIICLMICVFRLEPFIKSH
jgi:hypothetical protein